MFSFEDNNRLTGIAFTDVNTYITTVSSIKNFIMVGDILESVSFLCFQVGLLLLLVFGEIMDISLYQSSGGSLQAYNARKRLPLPLHTYL